MKITKALVLDWGATIHRIIRPHDYFCILPHRAKEEGRLSYIVLTNMKFSSVSEQAAWLEEVAKFVRTSEYIHESHNVGEDN